MPAGDTDQQELTKDPDMKEHKVDIKVDDLDIGRIPDTQGSNLPKLTQVIITNVPRRLKHNSKNLDQWILQVKSALAQLRLENLINSSVVRPVRGQHNYNRWVQWSRAVANWLYLQLDERLQQRLQDSGNLHSKADSLFNTILKVVREGEDMSARLATGSYDTRRISEIQAVRQYISAHKTQYHLLGSKILAISSLR